MNQNAKYLFLLQNVKQNRKLRHQTTKKIPFKRFPMIDHKVAIQNNSHVPIVKKTFI